MKKIFSFFVALSLFFVLQAADHKDYYKNVEGKKGALLKTALHKVIKNHNDVGYKGLYNVYKTSDNRNGKVWDMYSTCNFIHFSDKCGSYRDICDCYNREHMIPQSWFDEQSPMKSDAFHVYPTDGKVNNMRSSYPHGETNAPTIGGKALGKVGKCTTPGYTGTVYEPDDEYKGDIARTYFYFVTCYEDKLPTFHGIVLTHSAYPGLTDWFCKLMLKWHREDPVSTKEINRNNAIYIHQHNRNPFIDYPEMVEYIWGNRQNQPYFFENNTGIEENKADDLKIYSTNGTLYVDNFGDEYDVFSISGELVYRGKSHQIQLSNGVYIFRSGSEIIKITL